MSSRNIFSEGWITLRDLPDMVKFCQRRKRSLMIFGGAGLGKSQAVKQIADALFGARPDNMVDFRLADKEPTDVVGVQIPYTDEKTGETRTVYAVPDFWPRDPNWRGIIFLDELLHAEPYLQKVAFQIMLDRKIGNYKFPDGAIMIGAGNRPGDGTAVSLLEAPLANRMVLCELMYDTSVFIEDYAMHNDVHPSCIGYLSVNTSDIENYEAMVEIGCPSYSTPRTWVTASDILYEFDEGHLSERLAKSALLGTLGFGIHTQLWTYHTKTRHMTPMSDIMSGKTKKHEGSTAADMLWMYGSQGAIWLRKAISDTKYTDDEVVGFAANFLEYMHDNFNDINGDFVSSIFLSFITDNAYGKAILRDTSRDKLPAKLLAKYPVVMEIIAKYRADFAESVDEILA